ncbi:phosphosulfolactate synthase [Cohnella xylanilytica]|uniref:Phosphosulfolactate synthase n=1 Tax=Cohnella xylanilytica TaxID=557555 RepID=A0A841TWQ2_9BACL|nr:phosphosulfolactate synthase [Cohnella xylanilytica]MBB6692977.1 phosphosulfolactate synthase [Cohnella xylanilytica]GIO11820.1 phosphosulfolactate synthase [Cohnella xylanilytica]
MEINTDTSWPQALKDPSDRRAGKPRSSGMTMVIDKGLGALAFADLLAASGDSIDFVKFGFGTSTLYPMPVLRDKIALAQKHGIAVFPGGTLLEAAVRLDVERDFWNVVLELGFDGVEISDGTIELSRRKRDNLIREATQRGLRAFTEYGKKTPGSRIVLDDLRRTIDADCACGAELVTVEARESGVGVGLYDEKGSCREDELRLLQQAVPEANRLMWEAPQKDQQVALLTILGPEANLGNIAPQEVMSLEAMRRGLRSDTFSLHRVVSHYMI